MSNKETFKFEEPFKKEKEAFMEMMMEDHARANQPKGLYEFECRPKLTIEDVQDLIRLLSVELEMQYEIGMEARRADDLAPARRYAEDACRILPRLVAAVTSSVVRYLEDKDRVMREAT